MKDSVDKIVTTYFSSVTTHPFRYTGVEYLPKKLVVSPAIFRSLDCVPDCGACCLNYTLDYLPDEKPTFSVIEKNISISNVDFLLYSDPQDNTPTRYCRNLDLMTGRCKIHSFHAFSCDFEILRFKVSKLPLRPTYLGQYNYGRGWAMTRCSGEKGALCVIKKEIDIDDIIRRLERLKKWVDYFRIPSHLADIIQWVRKGPSQRFLVVDNPTGEIYER